MMRTCWVLAAAAAAILWMSAGTGRAGDDTLKLDLKKGKEAATTNLLGGNNGAETVLVGGHGGGHGHGGGGHAHGGGGGHVHAGHVHGGAVHAGHFHGGHVHDGHFHNGHFHNGAFVSVGLGFGFWPRWYYPYSYPYYYPSYYYSSYDYDPAIYYYPRAVYVAPSVYPTQPYGDPLSYRAPAGSSTLSTPGRPVMPRAAEPEERMPAPRPAPKDGTYQYDGGPASPVPMPQAEPSPGRKAGSTPAPDGRLVGLPSQAPKYSYQAYGDKPAARKVSGDQQLAARPVK